MYYSLTFTINGVEKNTWADWGMIPETPPMIPAPEPNLNYVDIPGRTGGPLDFSEVPFNKITYKRMSGSWTFLREPDSRRTRAELYDELVRYFTGRTGQVKLEEDLDHYYVGRFAVGTPTTGQGPIRFTIAFDLAPIRYNSANHQPDASYIKDGAS